MKTTNETLSYIETEIRSYLPTGWGLTEDGVGSFDAKKKVWRTMVIDNVDFDWPVEVKPSEVDSLGRLEALRQAIDRVFRERLGKRSFGPLNL
jgi:hypothetical protein